MSWKAKWKKEQDNRRGKCGKQRRQKKRKMSRYHDLPFAVMEWGQAFIV